MSQSTARYQFRTLIELYIFTQFQLELHFLEPWYHGTIEGGRVVAEALVADYKYVQSLTLDCVSHFGAQGTERLVFGANQRHRPNTV